MLRYEAAACLCAPYKFPLSSSWVRFSLRFRRDVCEFKLNPTFQNLKLFSAYHSMKTSKHDVTLTPPESPYPHTNTKIPPDFTSTLLDSRYAEQYTTKVASGVPETNLLVSIQTSDDY